MDVYLSEAMKQPSQHIISISGLAASLTARFETLRPRLRAWAERLLENPDDAEDALQEAFFRLWRRGLKSEETAGTVNLDAMSMTTVRSVCIDMLRSRKVRRSEPLENAENGTAETDRSQAEIAQDVTELIASRLDERTRNILLLHDVEDYSYPEIAKKYGLTEANCRLIVSRARKSIREAYHQYSRQ